jgi:DNA-binding PadR family transcriptional regulator
LENLDDPTCDPVTCEGHSNHRWHGFPERGWIQFLTLRILYEKPMHGYQLMKEIEDRSCGCHKLESGSIYTILRRMEEKGLIESAWVNTESALNRRVYKVTKFGAEALQRGLEMIIRRKTLISDLIAFYGKHFKEEKE